MKIARTFLPHIFVAAMMAPPGSAAAPPAAIHHHMTHEEPRLIFLHYWGRGEAKRLAETVKQALPAPVS